MSIQSEEVRRYFATRNLKQSEICRQTGVNKASVSQMLAGHLPFSKGAALAFSKTYGFNTDFLLHGTGSLFGEGVTAGEDSAPPFTPDADNGLLADAMKMIQKLVAENTMLRRSLAELTKPCNPDKE